MSIALIYNHNINVVPSPASLMLTRTSSEGNSEIQIIGSDMTLTCTVELNSAIVVSDISLLTVEAQLSRDGTPLTLTGPTVTGTTFTYTRQFESFGRNDSGNYTCMTTITPQPSSIYLTGSEAIVSNSISIKAGMSMTMIVIYI